MHFRNYTTIHPTIDGGGEVEVLAYVNSNLIVIHNDHNGGSDNDKSSNEAKQISPSQGSLKYSNSA